MKVVAALDRSPVNEKVVAMATRLVKAEGGEVLLLNVAPREPDVLGQQLRRKVITAPVPPELLDRYELLMHVATDLKQAGISCDTLLIRGDPGPALVREADRWGADIVVMGSHGRGALYKHFVGSVSEAVLKSRRFPVLIIPSARPK